MINEVVKKFETAYGILEKQSNEALSALSLVVKVSNDNEANEATANIARATKLKNSCVLMRKELTSPFDALKKSAMIPERSIEEEEKRARGVLNAYNAEQARLKREKEEELQKALAKKEEIIRVNQAIQTQLANTVEKKVSDIKKSCEDYIKEVNLSNYAPRLLSLKESKSKFSQNQYEEWLVVDYDKSLITTQEYGDIIRDLPSDFKFSSISKEIFNERELIVNHAVEVLFPKHKEYVLALEKASERERERLEKEKKVQEERARFEEKAQIEKERLKRKQALDSKANAERMTAHFEAQMAGQVAATSQNIRTNVHYTLDNDVLTNPSKIIDIVLKIMSTVFANPNFKGVIKRDINGYPKRAGKGVLVLESGVDYWLKEASKLKIDLDLDGLQKLEDVTTVIRK